MKYNIAIDGPSGAGKSALARALAARLELSYLDTGALYRTIGLYMHRAGLDITDAAGIASRVPEVRVELSFEGGVQRMNLNGEDVTEAIRLNEISAWASAVSKVPEVREYLFELQRSAAERGGVVMDGRDIGTVIMPDAPVKLFLTASNEVRAERRCAELKAKAKSDAERDAIRFEDILRDMLARDENDRTRSIAPCVPAQDAVILDNSGLDLEQTVEAAFAIVEKSMGGKAEK